MTLVPAYCARTIESYLAAGPLEILGALAGSAIDVDHSQKAAWEEIDQILRTAIRDLEGWVFLEFEVPRLGSRIDAVVISGSAIVPIEFKCGEQDFRRNALCQAWDYALDLKNFHLASHAADIFPLLVATGAEKGETAWSPAASDGVRRPRLAAAADVQTAIREAVLLSSREPIDGAFWGSSAYQPTPTIIEAARALYSRHSVEAITRNDARARNLSQTAKGIEEIIERSRLNREKSITFVTGVPGAGKTLVGLDVATKRRDYGEARAVFLSGNQPLVSVLQEALTRDEFTRSKGALRKGEIRQRVKPFIQNVHHFRDEGIRRAEAPYDHVVIFDEAQRAWDLAKTANFMKRRKKITDFRHSESEFLISYLDRHADWAAIICLVGGGQEIHTGEAGITAWLDAIRAHFPAWHTYVSPGLSDSEYAAEGAIDALNRIGRLSRDPRLHLAVSMRSFRSENVSAFVKALLDSDETRAARLCSEVSTKYPIVLTRDLQRAKSWVRDQARGSEQYGLLASSQAMRLKPHAIDIRVNVDPVHWFLSDRDDTRSSFFLEDAATEFQVQGLEVDWACVTWDADLRRTAAGWSFHSFRGDGWDRIRKEDRKRYLLNAYRVLLTRARQGMAIFVPEGDPSDPTRDPAWYDSTFTYLASLGVREI